MNFDIKLQVDTQTVDTLVVVDMLVAVDMHKVVDMLLVVDKLEHNYKPHHLEDYLYNLLKEH